MNVIFLDIDGVLNNHARAEYLHENHHASWGFGRWWALPDCGVTIENVGWDQSNVDALAHILSNVDAALVLSSTWKNRHNLTDMESYFVPFGLEVSFHSATPRVDRIGRIRGDEVNAWMEEHPETERWVCIDDDSDFHPENNLVQTDIAVGLTMSDAEKVIAILTGDKL